MDRYVRQTILSEVGLQGQRILEKTKVAIVGCGGLGSIVAPYLANAGVGVITLIDGDIPETSNLHRQVFFKTGEMRPKSEALASHIKKSNPTTQVKVFDGHIKKTNINTFLKNVDIVIECTDDIMTKYLVNDYCHLKNIPLVYGAIYKYDGYISLFENKKQSSIHLRDIFPKPNLEIPSCSDVGVFPTIAGIIGLFQANEALKYILDIGENLQGQLLSYNALNNSQLKLKLKKNFHKSIKEIYSSSSYQTKLCNTGREISWMEVQADQETYQLVSILKDNEHQDISLDVLRVDMDSIINNQYDWSTLTKTPVFYCLSGQRSVKVVSHLQEYFPDLVVFSLAGGLKKVID